MNRVSGERGRRDDYAIVQRNLLDIDQAKRDELAKAGVDIAAGKTAGTPRKKTIAAGPRPAAARRTRKGEPSALERLQSVIVGSLEDDKAENVVALDLTGKAMFCDRMIIASGLADRSTPMPWFGNKSLTIAFS